MELSTVPNGQTEQVPIRIQSFYYLPFHITASGSDWTKCEFLL